jgi:hypothetical protein
MACRRYRDALVELAAGAPAAAGLEEHLAGCDECRAELASLRRALGAVDAGLAELATAEPAPGFDARLRAAVSAAEAAADRTGLRLWPALVAAAAVLVAVALVVGRAPQPAVRPAPGRDPRAARVEPTPTLPLPEPPAPAPASGRAAPAPSRAAVAASGSREPEVLVPPGQVEALVRLASFVQRERLAPPGLLSTGQPPADLAVPPPIDIRPLEIVPLDPAEASGT